MYGSSIIVQDSIKNIQWKLSNETRMIAGFNCRKATGKIFDSVYVFAFYTDEILIPGGPASINGLPGTILGVTIPRLFTSWIATKVSVTSVAENDIKPVDGLYVFFRYDARQTVMTIMNTSTKTLTFNPADFAERTNGFSKGRDVITNSTMPLQNISVNSNQGAVIELMK